MAALKTKHAASVDSSLRSGRAFCDRAERIPTVGLQWFALMEVPVMKRRRAKDVNL